MPSLVRKKSNHLAPILRQPRTTLPVPADEEGYDISLTKSGWDQYFRLMHTWETAGYSHVQRIFQSSKSGNSWAVFVYLFKKGGVVGGKPTIETIIRAPSKESKLAFRNMHNDKLEPLTHIHSFIP